MRLIYRIALRLSLILLPLLALWAGLFYYTLVDEINDEADDALEDYSERVIIRMLAGEPLPQQNSGSNNSYTITPVDEEYASMRRPIDYFDAEVYIAEKRETEPARVLTTLFRDDDGQCYELRVATPTFEKKDLMHTILGWIILLYLTLLVTIVCVTLWVLHRSMRPLYALLRWFDCYTPGSRVRFEPAPTSVTEFRRLNLAAQQAVNRSEEVFERQNQFIGNASHELQTPLAVLGGRIEWLLNHTELTEEQMGELIQMKQTLNRLVRLNKTLLLLTKIENNQFLECADVDLASMLHEEQAINDEIFASRRLRSEMELPAAGFVVRMNESLASVLVTNLLRNAYRHTPEGGTICVRIAGRSLCVENDGSEALDRRHLFDRFHHDPSAEGSTGLGLSLVRAVADRYGLRIDYRFERERHCFMVCWP